MIECEKCHNKIPEDMKICPHCDKAGTSLFPSFYLYLALWLVAIGSAVHFRPFLGGSVIGEISNVALWVAFVVFVLFFIIFSFVCYSILREYFKSDRVKLTKEERQRVTRMQRHIASGNHFYNGGDYCTICGHKKS